MSQTSQLHPTSTPSPQHRPPSLKSGKSAISKSLKHAFTRRKRNSGTQGTLPRMDSDLEHDVDSQYSGSIGPESLLGSDHTDQPLLPEEAVLDSSTEPSPQRGRSPSRRMPSGPPPASPPRRRSRSLSRPDAVPIALSSPLPRSRESSSPPAPSPDLRRESRPTLSVQTSSNSIPSMSITPATPINPPSAPSSPDQLHRSAVMHQWSLSKLNNSTPIKEERPLPASGSVGSGMWGSLVNAANKVTDTISSLTSQSNQQQQQMPRSVSMAPPEISTGPDNLSRPRSQTEPTSAAGPPMIVDSRDPEPLKQMAVDTLGQGELSLRELGFESDSGVIPRSSYESNGSIRNQVPKEAESSPKQFKRGTSDLAIAVEHKRSQSIGRSHRSLTVPSAAAEGLNERVPANGVKQTRRLSSVSKRDSIRRGGRNESVASRASSEAVAADEGTRRTRKRSSLATADMPVEPPKSKLTAPEADDDRDRSNEDGLYIHGKDGKKRRVPITGFAVQSGKRNRDFHALFKSVEESDYLIEDYACALSKEILVQGRMYVSEHYICFNSNIFGWVTNLVIPFSEVVSLEKRSTAVLFPNGIQITTLHSKYVFASFVGRDGTYDLLTSIWRLSHPDSRSPDDPHYPDSDSLSRTSGSFSGVEGSDSEEHEDVSLDSNISDEEDEEGRTSAKEPGSSPSQEKKADETEATVPQGDTGPESHDKTECNCGKEGHYEKVVCDEIIKASLGKVWNCVFGDNSKDFLLPFLRDNQKVLDITLGDWKASEGGKRERHVSYIRPLNNSMGPKQTKCNTTEQIQKQDFSSFCIALTTTTTPDVPSGSSFQVMTKYCLTWAGGSSTRALITCTIEWSKSSWIKGAIEKGANEGQVAFAKDLISELRKKLETGAASGLKKKATGKKKPGKKRREEQQDDEKRLEEKKESGGVWGKVGDVIGSVTEIIGPLLKPLFSSTFLICILLFMVFYALIRVEIAMRNLKQVSVTQTTGRLGFGRTDQSGLWDWIETRVESVAKDERDGHLLWKNLGGDSLTNEGLEDVEDAIRTTEGKLKALKGLVEKKRA